VAVGELANLHGQKNARCGIGRFCGPD
jgi:hypothetical protein